MTSQSIVQIKTFNEALQLCVDSSTLPLPEIAGKIGMETPTLLNSIGLDALSVFPSDKIAPLMNVCGNTIPAEWLAAQMGRTLHDSAINEIINEIKGALTEDNNLKFSISAPEDKTNLITSPDGPELRPQHNHEQHAEKYFNISGVYAFWDKNEKRYIGESSNVGARWLEHLKTLKLGTHSNYKLQNAWNYHGTQWFRFDLLAITEGDLHTRRIKEAEYVNELGTYPYEYNLTPNGWPKSYLIDESSPIAPILDTHAAQWRTLHKDPEFLKYLIKNKPDSPLLNTKQEDRTSRLTAQTVAQEFNAYLNRHTHANTPPTNEQSQRERNTIKLQRWQQQKRDLLHSTSSQDNQNNNLNPVKAHTPKNYCTTKAKNTTAQPHNHTAYDPASINPQHPKSADNHNNLAIKLLIAIASCLIFAWFIKK